MKTAKQTPWTTRAATGAFTLFFGASLASAQTGITCTKAVNDFSSPGNCIPASSVPELGMLYPLGNEFYIDGTTGHVGMGTLNPNESLQIGEFFQTNQDNYIELRTIGGAGNEYKQGLKMRSSNPNFGFDVEHDDFLKGLNVLRYDQDFGAFGESALFIDRITGHVGIGTESPAQKLSIQDGILLVDLPPAAGSPDGSAILLSTPSGDPGMTMIRGDGFGGEEQRWDLRVNSPDNRLTIRDATAGSDRLNITTEGRVLIGTTGIGPSVAGTKVKLQDSGNCVIDVASESFAGINFSDSAQVHWGVGKSGFSDEFYVDEHGVGRRFTILKGGNVGIGTGSPTELLSVNGSAGKPGGGSWTVFSDARLKKNVHDLEGSLQRLLALRGVSFEYKDPEAIHELAGERIGFIAQEVEDVLPDWVDSTGEYKSLTIRGFEALAVEALREVTAEVRAKDAELAELRAEVERLSAGSARIDALERALAELSAGR